MPRFYISDGYRENEEEIPQIMCTCQTPNRTCYQAGSNDVIGASQFKGKIPTFFMRCPECQEVVKLRKGKEGFYLE